MLLPWCFLAFPKAKSTRVFVPEPRNIYASAQPMLYVAGWANIPLLSSCLFFNLLLYPAPDTLDWDTTQATDLPCGKLFIPISRSAEWPSHFPPTIRAGTG
jgi:hypothetical protein